MLMSSYLAHRLNAVVLLIAITLTALAAFTIYEMRQITQDAYQIRDGHTPQLERSTSLEYDALLVSVQLRHAMLARSPEERQQAYAVITAARQRIDQTLQDYTQAASSEEERRQAEAISQALARFWQVGERNLALIDQSTQAEAFAFLVDNTLPVRNALFKELRASVDLYHGALRGDVSRIETNAMITSNWMLILFVGIMVVLSIAVWGVGKALRYRLRSMQAVVERIKDGDFTVPVHEQTHDEFSALLHSMNAMQAELSRVVNVVRANAERVASASQLIAQGNKDLNERTERQGNALEKTSVSMGQLDSTVKQNADHAQQANQLAQRASEVAQQGGQVVNEVVQTMQGINESSRRIADITSTIDNIAFQTNILALNAAVEAARAGEQGRGFAVVASEVRTLAQRSAAAAKEIKSLINASVEQVDQGSALVDQAGATMNDVVAAIRQVTDIVGDISMASTHQRASVEMVSDAVCQMDRDTQQNAGLVQESALAAENLQHQACQLVDAVAAFKVVNSTR